jgi:hypothetical protein
MADNIAITAGAGTTVATDDVGGFHYQRVKLGLGADGAATDALGGAGAVAGGVQRVTLASDDPLVAKTAALGNAAAAASNPVVLSTEDIARVGIITEAAPASDTASSGLNGRLQRIAQNVTSGTAVSTAMSAKLPAALGSAAAASSLSVTQSTEDVARVGIITEAAPGTDTASSGLNGRLQRVAQNVTSMSAKLPASLGIKTAANSISTTVASDDALLAAVIATNTQLPTNLGENTRAASLSTVIATSAYSAAVTLTRTADTNVYTANDVIGAATGSTAALTFSSMAPAARGILLTSVSLQINDSAVISGETSYRLHLYNVTPPSALGDNAAWDLPSGDRASYLGYVDLGTPVDLGSTLFVQSLGYNKQILTAGTSVFAYLTTIGTYTPTSARVYVITLNAVAL